MNRAYSLVSVLTKGSDDQRVIEGVATTPTLDRVGDIVEPMGANFKLPLPFLWHHDAEKPVGNVEAATVTDKGINFRARIAKVAEPGVLRDRTDEAWHSIKAGLVRAVSIGFLPQASEPIKGGGRRFTSWEWHELSGVSIPANTDATIATAKFYDGGGLARSSWDAICDALVKRVEDGADERLDAVLKRIYEYRDERAADVLGNTTVRVRNADLWALHAELARQDAFADGLVDILRMLDDRLVDLEAVATSPSSGA